MHRCCLLHGITTHTRTVDDDVVVLVVANLLLEPLQIRYQKSVSSVCVCVCVCVTDTVTRPHSITVIAGNILETPHQATIRPQVQLVHHIIDSDQAAYIDTGLILELVGCWVEIDHMHCSADGLAVLVYCIAVCTLATAGRTHDQLCMSTHL
jgi:hypothetical protein